MGGRVWSFERASFAATGSSYRTSCFIGFVRQAGFFLVVCCDQIEFDAYMKVTILMREKHVDLHWAHRRS
jgi:hypothetical protein